MFDYKKIFSKIKWINGKPPAINQSNLNRLETAIDTLDNRVVEIDNNIGAISMEELDEMLK